MLTVAGLSVVECACGQALAPAPSLVLAPTGEKPLASLEAVVRRRLEQGACTVAFSGGRDSSLVLAAAVRAARGAGLPDPVALTLRYPGQAQAEETAWQERVIRHLRVDHWVRIELTSELDLLGPVARDLLRRHGPFFPANAHSLIPMLQATPGRTLLIGLGGDELLGCHRWTALHDVLAGRRRPQPRDLLRAGAAIAPAWLRGRLLARRERGDMPWLCPQARDSARRMLAREAGEPVRFDRYVARAAADRNLTLAMETLNRFAAVFGVTVSAPLIDPAFVSALARAGGPRGYGPRWEAMRAIAGDSLPAAVVERRDKAVFTTTFFTEETTAFAGRWSGRGLDEALVDPEQVRARWSGPRPDFRTALLLQAAWLHDDRVSAPAPVGAGTQ